MKRLYQRRSSSVKSCANGLLVDTGCVYKVLKMPKKRAKRGEITEFSRHSRKRLQNALLTLFPPKGWVRFGLCVTVPGQCDNWQEDWLKAVDRFWKNLERNGTFNYSGIYRVELQQRGMPHMHLVMFASTDKVLFAAAVASAAWRKALEAWTIEDKSIANNWREGITARWDEITHANSFRYLYDHQSKKKQAQLGYKGKQWGIFGRKWLSNDFDRVPLTENQEERLYKLLRRWSKTFYKGDNKGRLTRIVRGSCSYSVPLTEEQRGRILAFVTKEQKARRTECRTE